MQVLLTTGSRGAQVREWQEFLKSLGFNIIADGAFGENTLQATIKFQKVHNLVADGIVGPITWNFAESYFHPSANVLRSNTDVLVWIKKYLHDILLNVEHSYKPDEFCTITADWLAAIACRETGGLIVKYVNKGISLENVSALMLGDYTNGRYHGYGFFQIDIRSFPDFIISNDWKDPELCAIKASQVLHSKNAYLLKQPSFIALTDVVAKERAVTAAYNCGEGNVAHVLLHGDDIDSRTAGKDYSKQVFEFREIYKGLS